MAIETRDLRRIHEVFDTLSLPIRLLDAQGGCLVPKGGHGLPSAALLQDGARRVEGFWVRPLNTHPILYVAVAADAPGAADILSLADALVTNLLCADLAGGGAADVYRRVFKQELSGAELLSCANEQHIPTDIPRCVVLLQLENAKKGGSYSLLSELVPLAGADVLVEINRHQVALVKDMRGMDGIGELCQFAEALHETMLEEAIQTPCIAIAIGEEKQTLAQLGESYLEACRALEVGRVFRPEKVIHVFRRLMLERFLMNVPRDESLYYHGLLFNRRNAKLFNEEMLQTIEMFFRKDLSLSDTARQLYIHRNTLAYRLDKVQRQTGLDLRNFDDAVTFKILYELRKCGQEKPKQID